MWGDVLDFQTEVDTTFWEEYDSQYTADEFAKFLDEIVIPNPSLSNIALFTFFPDIQRNVDNYPVEAKLEELKYITPSDKELLYKMMNTEKGSIRDHIKFLNEMNKVVEFTLKNKSRYPKIPLENILKFNSYYRILKLKSKSGIVKEIRSVGTIYPVCWITIEITTHKGKVERIWHENYILSRPDPKDSWNELEKFFISTYKIFEKYPDKDEFIFGNTSKGSYLIRLYFRGKKINLPYSIHDGDFIFPVGDRYQPALGKEVFRAEQLGLIEPYSNYRKSWGINLEEVLRNSISSHDFTKGSLAAHIKRTLKGYSTARFRRKDHSTTRGEKPCTEDMFEVWLNCRYKRPHDKNTPNCERRKNGLCKWSEAKRRTYAKIEESVNKEGFDPQLDEHESEERAYHADSQKSQKYSWDILSEYAKDELDKRIVIRLKSGKYGFNKSTADFNINYSSVARELGVSYKTIQRHLKRLISKIKQK